MPIDMSAAVRAPQRKTTGSKATPTPVRVADFKTPTERRSEGLNGLGQLAQGVCLMFGLYADAATLGMHFPPVAKELANIAETNETIAKPIDFLIEIGPYGALIQAAAPLVMQMLANHRLIRADAMLGSDIVPPEVLEAQMKAQIMRVQAQAMRDQQAAMADAQAAQREMAEMLAAQNSNGSVAVG
jgi:hypothetical protein